MNPRRCCGLILDHHLEGFRHILIEAWRETDLGIFIVDLGVTITTFEDWKLPETLDDHSLFDFAQQNKLMLISGNRNRDDSGALDWALGEIAPDALPVLTPGDLGRTMTDRNYQLNLARSVAEILYGIDVNGQYLGSSRIYIPLNQYRDNS